MIRSTARLTYLASCNGDWQRVIRPARDDEQVEWSEYGAGDTSREHEVRVDHREVRGQIAHLRDAWLPRAGLNVAVAVRDVEQVVVLQVAVLHEGNVARGEAQDGDAEGGRQRQRGDEACLSGGRHACTRCGRGRP